MVAEIEAAAESNVRPAVTQADIVAAKVRLQDRVRQTPVIHIAENQIAASQPAFWLKLESLQCTGAFKARGALNALLASEIPAAGVCAASGGNHGLAVAWAARVVKTRASIFVPVTCPPIKLHRLASYGADVTVIGDIYEESLVSAREFARETGAFFVHPFDHPLTVAGVGTTTAEFVEQVPELDTILIAVGGGGLLAGSVAALTNRRTRVVAVEPRTADCLGAALRAGEPVDVKVSGVAVDSLGVSRVGRIGFEAATANDVTHIEVTDDAIRLAQIAAWEELRIGLEPGGATALGALLDGFYRPEPDEIVGVVGCGGNLDIASLLADA